MSGTATRQYTDILVIAKLILIIINQDMWKIKTMAIVLSDISLLLSWHCFH